MKTVFELIEANGLTLHGDIEHFAALVREEATAEANRKANASWSLMCEKMVAIEREACAKVCEDEASTESEGEWMGCAIYLANQIRERGDKHD